ncbi:MAG: NAD(P)-dependent oxidoreductase [Myxococcota bacterium]
MEHRYLVTGSAGHLGEGLMRTLRARGVFARGLDLHDSEFTDRRGSIADPEFVRQNMEGIDVVLHSATLHKPHIESHDNQAFVETNITGTLTLLEAAIEAKVDAFIFTSTTSTFGRALVPPAGAPAAWITEAVRPIPKNIYGVTKVSAEDLCELMHLQHGLPCLVLRTSRFFPEEDDDPENRKAWDQENLRANEYLHRRVDLEDAVQAHLLAAGKARELGFARYIISAPPPFRIEQALSLREGAAEVVSALFPDYAEAYKRRGWRMYAAIDRVYDSSKARTELGWQPRYDFRQVLDRLKEDAPVRSELARQVGKKGYHR